MVQIWENGDIPKKEKSEQLDDLQQKANSKNITQYYCLFIHHTLQTSFLVKLWLVCYHIVCTVLQLN